MVTAPRLLFTLVVGSTVLVNGLALPVAIAAQQAQEASPAKPTPQANNPANTPGSGTQDLTVLSRFQPWMLMTMVLSALAALLISLFMIYQYINNIRTTEFHRQILLDAVTQARYVRLMEEGSWSVRMPPSHLSYSADDTPKQREERERREAEQQRQLEQQRVDLEKRSHQTAKEEAAILVPRSLSVAGMGITGAFFIELTAILTVIFGIVILGLVGVLGTREIGPILSGIAGYVLGKTSNTAPPAGDVGRMHPPAAQTGSPTPTAAPQLKAD